jgi:hypothetical protein
MDDDRPGLSPEDPRDEGVAAPAPSIEAEEPARMLANEARARLEADGFTEQQILDWVEAYTAEDRDGEVDGLFAFIRAHEHEGPPRGPS